jgi:predicted nuclease of restriction endonuclease-like (RecB) superfamily
MPAKNFTKQFSDILTLAQQARNSAYKNVNAELINLYWQIGEYISFKIESSEWGMNVVDKLADFIQKKSPDLKGFDRRGLYRMKQFYETYSPQQIINSANNGADLSIVSAVRTQLTKVKKSKTASVRTSSGKTKKVPIVSPVVTQLDRLQYSSIRESILSEISWSNHLLILSKTTSAEERTFYLLLSKKESYSKRELERQINSGYYERVMLSKTKVSPLVTQLKKDISQAFKDTYVFEFLNLPGLHSENDLQKGLVQNIKKLLLELGKDFSFIGEEYKLKVGNKDYSIDLLFYHRELCCLVAFELKIEDFKPEHLGKLNFYLEALDRDVKKKHENPSVGVLLCKQKDDEVVEYALSRSLSPTMISKYKTQLINKSLLKKKLHELFQLEEARNKNKLL